MGCDIHPVAEIRRDGKWTRAEAAMPDDRDYRTFSVLAGVRNYGTDPAIVPISEPRGLPDDLAHDTDTDDLGDHSFSWLTLAELLSVDLDSTVTMTGVVAPEVAQRYRETGETPNGWCQGTSDTTWERITWPERLRHVAPLLPDLIDALKPLGDPADVRLVFGFDS